MPRWTRVIGDGLVYEGPCLLLDIIMLPDANQDYADIYDGRDTTSGKKFCRVAATYRTTQRLHFGQGIPFDRGIYVEGYDAAVETTVVFDPLPE